MLVKILLKESLVQVHTVTMVAIHLLSFIKVKISLTPGIKLSMLFQIAQTPSLLVTIKTKLTCQLSLKTVTSS